MVKKYDKSSFLVAFGLHLKKIRLDKGMSQAQLAIDCDFDNLPERLKDVVTRLKKVRIENKDALKVIKRFVDRPATLIYLNPPYLGDRTNGYSMDANCDDFHTQLLDLVIRANCMIFISGYANELYDSTLTPDRGWSRKEIITSTKDSKGQSHERI